MIGSQGVTKVGKGELIRQMQIQIWPCVEVLNTVKMVPTYLLHGRKTLHRDNGNCLSCLHPKATKLCLSLYVPETSQVTFFMSEPSVTAFNSMSLCTGTLKKCLGFLQPSLLPGPGWSKFPLFLTARYCGCFSSQHQYSELESPLRCWSLSLFQGGPQWLKYSSQF